MPFVSKATGIPLAKVATRVMWNLKYKNEKVLEEALSFYDKNNIVEFNGTVYKAKLKDHIAVKEAVFPFNKLPGADLILGPEMKSTGEVMGISSSFGESFAKAQEACKNVLPKGGKVFISLTEIDKEFAPEIAKELISLGFSIVATKGTHKAIKDAGIEAELVLKISEGRPNIVDLIKNGEIALAINTSDNKASKNDAKLIRQEVLAEGIPYFTTIAAVKAAISSIKFLQNNEFDVTSIQEYLGD